MHADLSSDAPIYVATQPTDLRKGFDGLSALVQRDLGRDPMRGGVYVFLNRRLTQMRALFWDRDGFCYLAKRLEQGTFRRVKPRDGQSYLEIESAELAMLLAGIDAERVRRRKRFRPAFSVPSASSSLASVG
jgi:transposase